MWSANKDWNPLQIEMDKQNEREMKDIENMIETRMGLGFI